MSEGPSLSWRWRLDNNSRRYLSATAGVLALAPRPPLGPALRKFHQDWVNASLQEEVGIEGGYSTGACKKPLRGSGLTGLVPLCTPEKTFGSLAVFRLKQRWRRLLHVCACCVDFFRRVGGMLVGNHLARDILRSARQYGTRPGTWVARLKTAGDGRGTTIVVRVGTKTATQRGDS